MILFLTKQNKHLTTLESRWVMFTTKKIKLGQCQTLKILYGNNLGLVTLRNMTSIKKIKVMEEVVKLVN